MLADLSHAYQVHKAYLEYSKDAGLDNLSEPEIYELWTTKLSSNEFRYYLLMHGKKTVGMFWGRILQDVPQKFLLEGRFLRRAYRGKIKFSREMARSIKKELETYPEVLMIFSSSRKIPKKYKIIGTLVSSKGGK